MGGYGGGGYGGGMMGGYGGGMMGGGMMGGGMMGGMMGGGMMGGDYNREYREFSLVQLIQETIEPDTWFEYGGEGSIMPYEGKKMIILQTPEIHKQIDKLLKDLQKSLGHQVSIEARFLVVSENFLEDISLDVDIRVIPGGKWKPMTFMQDTAGAVEPTGTKVPGSLAGTSTGLNVAAGYGTGLDDLQVNFLLEAVEAHKDSKTLTAPKVTVLSGEGASMSVFTDAVIALPPAVGSDVIGSSETLGTSTSLVPQFEIIQTGTSLNVTPIITTDKKHVLLNIVTTLNDFLGLKTYNLETPILTGANAGQVANYTQQLPETEQSQVYTRVNVPDGGTLLLGGQKITAEVESEAGIPVLSKLPGIGRLFRNRSKVRDNKILLILVKPTIILQEERDAEALADDSGGF
jgi:general secretion pathway protein D